MTKETEKEVIEIDLTSELNHLLIKDLESTIKNISYNRQKEIPQFRFLESVLQKSKQKKPRLFSARECSTISGYLAASLQMTKKKEFELIQDVFEQGLKNWEKQFIN